MTFGTDLEPIMRDEEKYFNIRKLGQEIGRGREITENGRHWVIFNLRAHIVLEAHIGRLFCKNGPND